MTASTKTRSANERPNLTSMHWLQSRENERKAYSSPHLIWHWSSFSVLKSHTSGQSRTALLHHCCRLGWRSRERRFKRFQNINILCTPSRHHFVSLPVHTHRLSPQSFSKTLYTQPCRRVFFSSVSSDLSLWGREKEKVETLPAQRSRSHRNPILR